MIKEKEKDELVQIETWVLHSYVSVGHKMKTELLNAHSFDKILITIGIIDLSLPYFKVASFKFHWTLLFPLFSILTEINTSTREVRLKPVLLTAFDSQMNETNSNSQHFFDECIDQKVKIALNLYLCLQTMTCIIEFPYSNSGKMKKVVR